MDQTIHIIRTLPDCHFWLEHSASWQARVARMSFRRSELLLRPHAISIVYTASPSKEKMDGPIVPVYHCLMSSKMTLFPLSLKAQLSIILKNLESQRKTREACFTVYNGKTLWENSAFSSSSCSCLPVIWRVCSVSFAVTLVGPGLSDVHQEKR